MLKLTLVAVIVLAALFLYAYIRDRYNRASQNMVLSAPLQLEIQCWDYYTAFGNQVMIPLLRDCHEDCALRSPKSLEKHMPPEGNRVIPTANGDCYFQYDVYRQFDVSGGAKSGFVRHYSVIPAEEIMRCLNLSIANYAVASGFTKHYILNAQDLPDGAVRLTVG